jgi:predicted RNase H-like HicB family nuclease
MAVDTQVMSYDLTEVTPAPPMSEIPAQGQQYTGIAVFDGSQWSSLCPELDIASVGVSADEALRRLEEAVRETLAYAEATGRSRDVFRRVPDEDLRDFLLSQQPGLPALIRPFRA